MSINTRLSSVKQAQVGALIIHGVFILTIPEI